MPTRIRSILISGSIWFLAPLAHAEPVCPPSAPDGYWKAKSCIVTIDRENPASPSTIVVHGGTTVKIRLENARANEVVTFTPTTTQVPPVDFAGTLVKNLITPLQGLIIGQRVSLAEGNRLSLVQPAPDPIQDDLDTLLREIGEVHTELADASIRLACLESYHVVARSQGRLVCSRDPIPPGRFDTERNVVVDALSEAARAALPLADYASVESRIKKFIDEHTLPDGTLDPSFRERANRYLTIKNLANAVMTDIQKAQAAMSQTAQEIASLPLSPAVAEYSITRGKSFNSSIAIVAQDVISKTNTNVATVTVNWQSNHWIVSLGVGFTALRSATYTNAPLIVNGQVERDDEKKIYTYVQEADTRPTILAPLVLANYKISYLSRFGWQNKCPNHCAFLLSGGAGLNVYNQSAEFLVGPSFQFGGALFTVGAHIGRFTDLSQGVVPGAQLGVAPPSPLPTAARWTVKWGFGLTYALPF